MMNVVDIHQRKATKAVKVMKLFKRLQRLFWFDLPHCTSFSSSIETMLPSSDANCETLAVTHAF